MSKSAYEGLSGGILLVGLGILFLVPGLGFWPWILVVVGLASLPAALANNSGWYGWQGFFWLVGLAVLFRLGRFWPGILILVGVSMLVGALTRESEGSPFAEAPASGSSSWGSRGGDTRRLNARSPADEKAGDEPFDAHEPD